jgi:dUTP pyrophosphatase
LTHPVAGRIGIAMTRPSDSFPEIGVVRLPHAEGLPLPAYETAGAAGMDLRAAVPDDRPILLLPGRRAPVPTGLVMEIPEGYEGQVRPRSGLALKHGVTCLNTPGTVDSDYRGEVKVLIVNLGEEPFVVTRGMRIAQIVFARVARLAIAERGMAGATLRGAGGFGSTGTG